MTKLDEFQKQDRKDLKALFKARGGVLMSHDQTTVAVLITGPHTAKVATAVCSDDEPKFRRKVGEYLALSRWRNLESISVTRYDGEMAEELADRFLGVMS
jgi:hypothetical protein